MKIEADIGEAHVWVTYSEKYAQFITKSDNILFESEPLCDVTDVYDVEIVGNFYEDPSIFGINREQPKDQLLLSFDHCDMAEGKDHCCVMVGKIEKGRRCNCNKRSI